jgi:hypothetical protein
MGGKRPFQVARRPPNDRKHQVLPPDSDLPPGLTRLRIDAQPHFQWNLPQSGEIAGGATSSGMRIDSDLPRNISALGGNAAESCQLAVNRSKLHGNCATELCSAVGLESARNRPRLGSAGQEAFGNRSPFYHTSWKTNYGKSILANGQMRMR